MKKLHKYTSHPALFLYISIFLLSFLFVFNKHFVELTGTLETWFPYKGIVLYKDIATFHFPLGRYILMPFHLLSNWNLEIDPFLGLAVGITNLIVIYTFGRRYLSRIAINCSLLFFSLFYWYFATGILFFHEQLIGLLLSVVLILYWEIFEKRSITFKKIFWIGILLSIAELSGQLATLTIGCFAFLILFTIWKYKSKYKLIRYFLYGLILPLLLLIIHFASSNALIEFIYWNTVYYFVYTGSASSSLGELPWREITAFFIPLIIIVFSMVGNYFSKTKIPSKTLHIILLVASTIPFTIFSIFHLHHFNYALGILSIAAGLSLDSIAKKKHPIWVIIIFLFLSVPIFQWYSERLVAPNFRIANDVYPNDPMYDTVEWVKNNTNQTSGIMVVGDPLFYMRSNRLPVTRVSKGIPYSWEPIEKTSIEINSSIQADYWIIDTIAIRRLIDVSKKQAMVDFINDKLSSEYSKIVTFKNWEIWKRK